MYTPFHVGVLRVGKEAQMAQSAFVSQSVGNNLCVVPQIFSKFWRAGTDPPLRVAIQWGILQAKETTFVFRTWFLIFVTGSENRNRFLPKLQTKHPQRRYRALPRVLLCPHAGLR